MKGMLTGSCWSERDRSRKVGDDFGKERGRIGGSGNPWGRRIFRKRDAV